MATKKSGGKTSGRGKAIKTPSAVELIRGDVLALKRERILHEAAALFYERGYLQTSVDALAERMGATKPFIYYHFASKAEILIEICESGTGDALMAIERALETSAPLIQRFEAFVREFTRIALTNHVFVAIYFREEFNLPDEARERINQMRRTINRKLQNLLAEGQASGEFDIEDPGISALVISGMSSYAFAWYRDKGRLDLERVTEHIVEMSLKLVRPVQA